MASYWIIGDPKEDSARAYMTNDHIIKPWLVKQVKESKGSHHKKKGKNWENFPNRLGPPPPIGNFRLF